MISRNIFFLLIVCVAMACQNSGNAQQATEERPSETAKATISTNSPVAHLNPPMMEGTYPFDITLRRADGKDFSSSEVLKYEDGPTIISFWLTTCGPCMIEFANMKKKFAKWEEEMDFKFVAISTDFPKNYDAFVRVVNEKDWPWESYNDVNRNFWRHMPGGLNGLPQVFVYDENGEIAYYKRKYRPGDEDILFEKIRSMQ